MANALVGRDSFETLGQAGTGGVAAVAFRHRSGRFGRERGSTQVELASCRRE